MIRQLIVAALAVLALATPALGAPGDQTIETLKTIAESDAIGLEAWLHGNAPDQVHVGDEVGFRFRSETAAYLTTLYVDATGTVTVLHSGGESHQIRAGEVKAFPHEGSAQQLLAQPPLGSEFVFTVATLDPIPQHMFADKERKLVLVYERPEEGRQLAQRLADYMSTLPEGSVDAAWFVQKIVPEGAARRYTSRTIVEHFTTRTRALTRPKLDLDIQFEFGSDELTTEARQDLDELGKALEHPAMKSRRFELAGHTDDVGEESYNLSLSEKRAKSARDYLMSKYEIDSQSLRLAGYGESKPAMKGGSHEARRRNRRVVIEQLP
jgi:outer membrane protein OmpA-like peptidoglycan-associated protein